MIFLLDTNAISDLMRDHPQVEAHLASVTAPHQVVICSIVRGEIRYGIERLPNSKRRRDLDAKAAHLCAVLPCDARSGGGLLREREIEPPAKGAGAG